MSKPLRFGFCVAALAALLIPSRGFSVSAVDPAQKFRLTINLIALGSRIDVWVYPADDKGVIISGATITVNNRPLQEIYAGKYAFGEPFSVPFSAPFVLQFRFKPPSPPYWPTEIAGTINVPNQIGIVKPQKHQIFTRGVGDGISFAWRTSAGSLPVQIYFSASSPPYSKWNSAFISAAFFTVPWSSIPAVNGKYIVEVKNKGQYGFNFSGPVHKETYVFGIIYDSMEITIKDITSFTPKKSTVKIRSPIP